MQYTTVHSQEPPPADARRGSTKEPPQKKMGLIGFILVMLMHPTPGQPNETRVALYAWHGSVVRNALWELNHS